DSSRLKSIVFLSHPIKRYEFLFPETHSPMSLSIYPLHHRFSRWYGYDYPLLMIYYLQHI
ncbi:hypothetical protein KAX75_06900, partial [candidate division WOR-3 bacterium]|nr:hypothetical protein [candidate division WOR-3 bacterium]